MKKWLYKIGIYDLVGSSCGAGDGRGHRDAGLCGLVFSGEAAKGGLVTWSELQRYPARPVLPSDMTCVKL